MSCVIGNIFAERSPPCAACSTEGNVGIPIGNQTSQLFALLYLDGMDHFIKEKLGIKFYGRYMDDFFLIHKDKEYLRHCRKEIEAFVQARGLRY